ncbi:type I methionyl aminopeptidase [Limibacterium fermenti]|jgi:methionyl aminopeptidase|uniref:type I methionyl aminopeptidase n=1 Tax=Limibacterium fermenti TaxID=3229863 RepID=UPI000E97B59F|nr:type I methionyl aminopeptidase [Porphyromonadaceae bacterium]HBX19426.1 type I methionyl aminopeptidase [Porphyromonadaceae bacterium]HCM20471.1 type I methionyl aminopeptidase [Porphyromonadaceae bacterium]
MNSRKIILKTAEEIEFMRESNRLVGMTLGELSKHVKPGVTTLQLDRIAEEFIRDHGAIPTFLGYGGFPNSICTSVNENVVHGIPNNTPLKEGDVISVDCGTLKHGYAGDSAYTFCVGEVDEKVKNLLKVTKESLYKGIEQAKVDHHIGDIGYAVQSYCESHGYTVVRELVGHGIGREMHEAPEVPNYGKRGTGPLIKEGMCIAIEPMINLGSKNVVFENDGWTVRTKDRKPSAHFEHTIAIRNGKADILSTFEFIQETSN